MNLALASMIIPWLTALMLLLLNIRRGRGLLVLSASIASFAAGGAALLAVVANGSEMLIIGGWPAGLGIRLQLTPLVALLITFTALIHALVALYAAMGRTQVAADYWPLSALLHGSLVALWLSADLFNLYVTLELLSLAAVSLVTLAGPKSYPAAFRYLLLSLAGSLCYLLGVALIYKHYHSLDMLILQRHVRQDELTQLALLMMTLGLMLKAALWPLHLWLPPAHASAPTAVSALLSALVVKGPLFILWNLWSRLAPEPLSQSMGPLFATAGLLALIFGGWSALRAPHIKTLVAYSTVAQLGYATLALGLLLRWQDPQFHVALWLFVIAHALAKVSMFLAAGELQKAMGTKRITGLKGATQSAPVAMFAFAVAGGSLIGLPPSGGFLAKWVLLQPMFVEPERWPWALGVLLGTVISAAYVFRAVSLGFHQGPSDRPALHRDRVAEWLAMLPAVLVWGLALVAESLLPWLGGLT